MLKGPIEMFITNEKSVTDCSFTPEDWELISEVTILLKPLEQLTKYLSKSHYVSISMVLPAYAACIEEIRTIAVEYPALKIAQQKIEKKLQKYYDSTMSKNIYYIATILDPRFKLLHFKGRRDCAAIKQKFLRESKMFAKYCEKNTSDCSGSANNETEEEAVEWIDKMFSKKASSLL